MTYLDHAATTPMRPEAKQAWLESPFGNASSLHQSGRSARSALEQAREDIAEIFDRDPNEVVVTSGGTAADNLAVRGIHQARIAQDPHRNLLVVSTVEHHAVLDSATAAASATGAQVAHLPVTVDGVVQLAALRELLASEADRISVVSVMSINNEVGAAQPINEIAAVLSQHGIPLHIDAVQSAGWQTQALPVTAAVSLSGHKFGAPVGVGALLLPNALPVQPVMFGGGQERKLHSGTLNVAGAQAMAAALQAARASDLHTHTGEYLPELRAELAELITSQIPDAILTAPQGDHPGIVHAIFPEAPAEILLMLLDRHGICASAGSACSAGVTRASHVTMAMGYAKDQAACGLRLSLGWTSTRVDLAAVAQHLPMAVAQARRVGVSTRTSL